MALRYLRRPPKPAGRKAVARKMKHGLAAAEKSAVRGSAIEVADDECTKLAHALAYFCVACGREHTSGEIRECDLARAQAEIIDVIRRAQ